MKINKFWSDLTDFSAEKEVLCTCLLHTLIIRIVFQGDVPDISAKVLPRLAASASVFKSKLNIFLGALI